MATTSLVGLFHTDTDARDKFLSRVLGIFSEEVVRCWGKAPQAPYEDLGRPTIKRIGQEKGGHTLDFTFRSKSDDRVYIAEMKCEMQREKYRYLTLESPAQLDHHNGKAFKAFLDAARNTTGYAVTVNKRPQPINGAILVWGRTSEEGRASVASKYGFADVLSLEAIIHDLLGWRNQDYTDLIRKYQTWCGELFAGLRTLGNGYS